MLRIILLASVLRAADAAACPLDEGGITLHPVLAPTAALPSDPSLYFTRNYRLGAEHVEFDITSNGQSVPFQVVPLDGDSDDALAWRIDIELEAGPLHVESRTTSRTFKYDYRVVPDATVSHYAALVSVEDAEEWHTLGSRSIINSEAALVRVEWLHDGEWRPDHWMRSEWLAPTKAEVFVPHSATPFRVVGIFTDQTTAVLWDPSAPQREVIAGIAAEVRARLAPPAQVATTAPARAAYWLLGVLLVLATALALGARRTDGTDGIART